MRNFFLFLCCFVISTTLTILYIRSVHPSLRVPQKLISPEQEGTAFSLATAPSESLRASLTAFSGEVAWQSRTATEPAKLMDARTLEQGESILTKETGNTSIQLQNALALTLAPNTSVDFIQTLPINIVLAQNSGSVLYDKLDATPVSIRALHLLIQLSDGSAKVNVSPVDQLVTITAQNSSLTLAYTDTNNTSVVTPLSAGASFLFHDDTRVGIVE